MTTDSVFKRTALVLIMTIAFCPLSPQAVCAASEKESASQLDESAPAPSEKSTDTAVKEDGPKADVPQAETGEKDNRMWLYGGLGVAALAAGVGLAAGGGGSDSSGSSVSANGYSTQMLAGCWDMKVQNENWWATYCFDSSGNITKITNANGYPTSVAEGRWTVSSSGAISGSYSYKAIYNGGVKQWWVGSVSGQMNSATSWTVPLLSNGQATMRGTKL